MLSRVLEGANFHDWCRFPTFHLKICPRLTSSTNWLTNMRVQCHSSVAITKGEPDPPFRAKAAQVSRHLPRRHQNKIAQSEKFCTSLTKYNKAINEQSPVHYQQ